MNKSLLTFKKNALGFIHIYKNVLLIGLACQIVIGIFYNNFFDITPLAFYDPQIPETRNLISPVLFVQVFTPIIAAVIIGATYNKTLGDPKGEKEELLFKRIVKYFRITGGSGFFISVTLLYFIPYCAVLIIPMLIMLMILFYVNKKIFLTRNNTMINAS